MLRRAIVLFVAVTVYVSTAEPERRRIFASRPSIDDRRPTIFSVTSDLYENACTSERCNDVAELFLKSVKKSVQPCDDFYAHACGKRQRKTRPLTDEIQEILEQPAAEETRPLALERKLYKTCLEQQENDYRTKREFTRLLRLSNGLGLFELSQEELGRSDWTTIDSQYASRGFEPAFFDVRVERDPADGQVNLISLTPPSLKHIEAVRTLLKRNLVDIISKSIIHSDRDEKLSVVDYEDVIEFNNALDSIRSSLGSSEESIKTLINNKFTVDKWQKEYDFYLESESYETEVRTSHIDWLKILNDLFRPASIRVNPFEKILVRKKDYFFKLGKLLGKTSPATIEKYIHFKFLIQIGKYLSPELSKYIENVNDRSEFCIERSDNQLIGATYEYIKRYIPHGHKLHAEKVTKNVRDSLIDLLSSVEWMDDETKAHATRKLRDLSAVIGYPDWQTNRTFINNYYGTLHLHANYFENALKYKKKSLIHELRGLKHPHTFDPLTMSKKLMPLIYHFEVNSHSNRIYLPIQYLNEKSFKLFGAQLPSAINYGSFGSMIGSVLYDYVSLTDNWVQGESYSRTTDGLSKESIEAYKVKEKCLSNQLVNYKKLRSQLDLPYYSIVDSDTIQVDKIYEKTTGLTAALVAYESARSDDPELLPGFESTTDHELFFLSYAERICEIGDVYDKYDAYEPALKINGVLSNLREFSDAFQCFRHDRMNREFKCALFS